MHLHHLLPLFAAPVFSQLVIDRFTYPDPGNNALDSWHGCDEADGFSCAFTSSGLTITSSDTDYSFYTQFAGGCQNTNQYNSQYLHVSYSGSAQFTIALQQHNAACDENVAPYPFTWDVVNAADYANGGNIYVPMSHFNIEKVRTVGVAFKAFRQPGVSTTLKLVEIVATLPGGVSVPGKKATGPLYFACTRPNSIAFGIDDGVPALAQQMMQLLKDEKIKVTFFTVGTGLDDPSTNFTNLYKEAIANGHQVALHTYTHPKIESLSVAAIDSELSRSREATLRNLGVNSKYFRAPYGTDGALTRQRLEALIPGSKVINWSIDVEDWLWAQGPTPELQTAAVARDIGKGGNLFVMHYLYPSTVAQFKEFVRLARATGKDIMRVDQCLQDPSAPPFP